MSVSEKMTAIADAIRLKTGCSEALTLDDMAMKIPEVYSAGYEEGKLNASDDSFWDLYQDGGNRTNYSYAFRNEYWTDEIFTPKYKMYPIFATYMFAYNSVTDYEKISQYIDFSNCTGFSNAFSGSVLPRIPALNLVNVTSASSSFAGMGNLHTIDKLIINNNGSFPFRENTFNSCSSLKEIRFEGVIGVSLYMKNSFVLSKASIENIFACLSDTVTGQSVNLAKNAINRAFGTDGTTTNGSASAEWAALIATKPNWTVNLI